MNDMIRNRNAKFAALEHEIDSLKQTLPKNVKEKESLLQTYNVFKMESKAKENKYMDKEIDLEKKIKELDNIVYKVDVMNTVMHDDSINVNVLPTNKRCLVYDYLGIEKLEQENYHLFKLLLSQDIVLICVNSLAARNDYYEMQQSFIHEYNENLVLEAELAKKEHMVEKNFFDEVVLRYAPEFRGFFIINDLKAQLKAKNVSIKNLKKHIANLKGKNVVECAEIVNKSNVVTSNVYKLDLPPLSSRLKNNREAYIDYLKVTQEHTHTLRDIVKHAWVIHPLDNELNYACQTEAPSELSKVSMVKTIFQKLKNHLASFDKVVKVWTTPNAIIEGSWGFEHTKAVFKHEVIPFIKTLWDSFKDFDNGLHNELNKVKTVFNQIEAAVEQCSVDKKYFDIQKKEFFLDNDRLLEHIIRQDVTNIVMHADSVHVNMLPANNKCLVHDNLEIERLEQENDHLFELLLSQDIVHICVNSLATRNNCCEMQQSFIHAYNENLMLKAELAKKEHMVEKKFFDDVVLRCSRLKNHSANLELKLQHKKESFLNNKPLNNTDAPEFRGFFIINDLKAQLKAKNVSIKNLKKHIANLKGKNVVECAETVNKSNVVTSNVYKLDLPPLSPRLKNNREAYIDYLKVTQEHTHTLRDIVKHARVIHPLDNELNYACQSKPRSNTRNNRISQTSSSNQRKNKVEEKHRIAKSSLNKKNSVSTSVCNESVKPFVLNAKSELICVSCNECLFNVAHDSCVVDFIINVNVTGKSKFMKAKSGRINKKEWKPTRKIFSSVGHRWLPTGRNFTIVGNSCPLTRITSTKVVPPNKNVPPKPNTNVRKQEIKVFHRSTKVAKAVRFNDTHSILGPKTSNMKELNKHWGSTVSNAPSFFSCQF
ncbi:hypothetical protein Tco_0348729 [Tanacetum coccineum]